MWRRLAFVSFALVGCSPLSPSAKASLARADARRVDEAHEALTPEEPSSTSSPNADAVSPLDDRPVSSKPGRFFAVTSVTRVIGAVKEAPTAQRPAHRRFIDLNLRQAKTADALQFLADSGGFNLVLQGDLAAPVTVSLHHVDPFDALEVIAESEHLAVEMRRGIVIVGGH